MRAGVRTTSRVRFKHEAPNTGSVRHDRPSFARLEPSSCGSYLAPAFLRSAAPAFRVSGLASGALPGTNAEDGKPDKKIPGSPSPGRWPDHSGKKLQGRGFVQRAEGDRTWRTWEPPSCGELRHQPEPDPRLAKPLWRAAWFARRSRLQRWLLWDFGGAAAVLLAVKKTKFQVSPAQ